MKTRPSRLPLLIAGLTVVVLASLSLVCPVVSQAAPGVELFVAPNGNDAAAGTQGSPLRTLAGARNKVRALKAGSGLPDGGVTVRFRGGNYPVRSTAEFDVLDSGTATKPITYAAYPGETPVFSGGTVIAGADFAAVTNDAILTRLPTSDARSKVVQYNLFEHGFTAADLDYSKDFWKAGTIKEYVDGGYAEYIPRRIQVFVDDQALDLARYPNKVPGTFAENPYNAYLSIPRVINPGGDDDELLPKFTTDQTRIKRWKNYQDIIIFGTYGYEFGHQKIRAKKIDPGAMTIELTAKAWDAVDAHERYAFENVLDELDYPGEYYIDKTSGILYLYPPKSLAGAKVSIPRFDENWIFTVIGASYLDFSGLTFELTKGSVGRIEGGRSVSISNCTVQKVSVIGFKIGEGTYSSRDITWDAKNGFDKDALEFSSATRNGLDHAITGSVFRNIGYQAASIFSGDSLRREPSRMRFEGNLVTHTGLYGANYFSGLVLNGVGITVKGNEFSYTLGQAINGNIIDTEIINNEFFDSPSDMAEDTGTIYINYSSINDGVRVRYNYFHDTPNVDRPDRGFDFARRVGIYYDNSLPFADLSYNVLYKVNSAPNIVSNTTTKSVLNNVFIDTAQVAEHPTEDIRDKWWSTPAEVIAQEDSYKNLINKGPWQSPEWRILYPELFEYLNYFTTEKQTLDGVMSDTSDNLVVNLSVPMSGRGTTIPAEGVGVDAKYGRVQGNHFTTVDPGFANYAAKDFQLSKSTAAALGMEWLDMSKMGLPKPSQQTRLADKCGADPKAGAARIQTYMNLDGGAVEAPAVVLWREVSPGCWVWADQSLLSRPSPEESLLAFDLIPGATYTWWYAGDSKHYAQFLGGKPGQPMQPPPDGVTKFVGPTTAGEYWNFQLLSPVTLSGVISSSSATIPAGTRVEFRAIVPGPNGTPTWDYTLSRSYTVGLDGRFIAIGLLPGVEYAAVVLVPGRQPFWPGGITGELEANDSRLSIITAPQVGVVVSQPMTITVPAEALTTGSDEKPNGTGSPSAVEQTAVASVPGQPPFSHGSGTGQLQVNDPPVGAAISQTGTLTVPGKGLAARPVVGVKVAQKSVYLVKKKSITIAASGYTAAGVESKVTYKSSRPKVATVKASGKITAKKKGKAIITAMSANGKTAKIIVKVVSKKPQLSKARVKKVTASIPKTIEAGAMVKITGTYKPATAVSAKVTYKSSKTSIATISKTGILIAKKPGRVTILVKAGPKRVKYTVAVK